jgi:anti-anti-sigma factor
VEFGLRIHGRAGDQTIACSGPLTAATSARLDEAIQTCLEEAKSHLLLDCRRVTSIDFSGVASLLRGLQACRERGVRLRASFGHEAQRVLDAAGLWWFGVVDGGVSTQTALARARRFFSSVEKESQGEPPRVAAIGDGGSVTRDSGDIWLDIREPATRNRVLLVDDDPAVRHTLRLLFEVEEFEVVGEASDGIEAVALGLRHSPDFIIIDYAMPRMDGEKAARVLEATVPDARIVAFSAYLDSKPDWAHAYLNKDRIVEIVPVMQALIAADDRSSRTEPV